MSRVSPRNRIAPLLAGLTLGVGALLLAYGAVCRSDAAEPAASAAATPEEALAAYVILTGGTFAGPCAQTRSPDDIGKICAGFVDERDNRRAYLLGRTFSEFTTWVFLSEDGRGWTVLASAPLDFHDTTMVIPWPR